MTVDLLARGKAITEAEATRDRRAYELATLDRMSFFAAATQDEWNGYRMYDIELEGTYPDARLWYTVEDTELRVTKRLSELVWADINRYPPEDPATPYRLSPHGLAGAIIDNVVERHPEMPRRIGC